MLSFPLVAEPADPLVKLRNAAASDPGKLTELMTESLVAPISSEARTVLEKRPEFSPDFLEREARARGLTVEQVTEIASQVISQGAPGLVVEAREFGVDAEARAHLRGLYESEIQKRRKCNRWITIPVVGARRKEKKPCDVEFTSFDQALVHHSLHILFDADYRTQRSHWNDIRELIYPTQERGLRAALTAEERRRMLLDPRLRERLRT